jgi:hypothetical protein
MAAPVIAVEVLPISNTITSLPFLVAEAVNRQIFNYFVCPATEVNRTAAPAKYMVEP